MATIAIAADSDYYPGHNNQFPAAPSINPVEFDNNIDNAVDDVLLYRPSRPNRNAMPIMQDYQLDLPKDENSKPFNATAKLHDHANVLVSYCNTYQCVHKNCVHLSTLRYNVEKCYVVVYERMFTRLQETRNRTKSLKTTIEFQKTQKQIAFQQSQQAKMELNKCLEEKQQTNCEGLHHENDELRTFLNAINANNQSAYRCNEALETAQRLLGDMTERAQKCEHDSSTVRQRLSMPPAKECSPNRTDFELMNQSLVTCLSNEANYKSDLDNCEYHLDTAKNDLESREASCNASIQMRTSELQLAVSACQDEKVNVEYYRDNCIEELHTEKRKNAERSNLETLKECVEDLRICKTKPSNPCPPPPPQQLQRDDRELNRCNENLRICQTKPTRSCPPQMPHDERELIKCKNDVAKLQIELADSNYSKTTAHHQAHTRSIYDELLLNTTSVKNISDLTPSDKTKDDYFYNTIHFKLGTIALFVIGTFYTCCMKLYKFCAKGCCCTRCCKKDKSEKPIKIKSKNAPFQSIHHNMTEVITMPDQAGATKPLL